MSDQDTHSGPWADQLAQRFEDPEQRAAVDAFLRETVQPHVTKLEQRGAELQDAQRLYEDLTQNPADTYVAITAELFGDDAAERVLSAIRQGDVKEVTDAEGHTEVVPTAGTTLDPVVKEVVDYVNSQRQASEYDQAVDDFIAAHADDKIVKDLFHPFVAGADGNLEAARAGYQKWAQQWAEAHGETPAVTEADVPDPPPTLGSGPAGDSPTVPPTQRKYNSLDDALDDFFAERKVAPPVVGSV